ncbi:hypothetical protein BB561_006297 [Smittium simulii]|uniref:Cytochrome P450 n=1 Tax=Smittium simulii TaxID=133385 RepID=A0A2T9Y5A8_9FUNG|nr:hypothetical protein BB561_006297 [Smittium simulii]
MAFNKNVQILDKRIYHLTDYGNHRICGKKFLAEYYSYPEKIFGVTKSHLYSSLQFASFSRFDHKGFESHRYFSLFTSIFKLDAYINRVQEVLVSDIQKSVLKLGKKIDLDQYQVDDIFEFIGESILAGTERRIFKNYTSAIIQEHKTRSVKFSVKVSKFILDNQDIFDPENLDQISLGLINTIIIALSTLNSKIYDTLFYLFSSPNLIKYLYDEQTSLIASYGPQINYTVLSKMNLLDKAIKDAVRLSHNILFAKRYLNETVTFSNGVTVPKGSFISLNGTSIHRVTNIRGDNTISYDCKNSYSRDETFNNVSLDNLSWSVGSRMCLAKEFASNFMKEYFAILIREFYFEPLYTNHKTRKIDIEGLNCPKSGAIFIKR